MSEHSKLGASSADRWMACPASIRLSEGIPDSSNHHARKGTAAHEVASKCLLSGADADSMIGQPITVPYHNGAIEVAETFYVDEEMANAVQLYLDTIRKIIADYGQDDAELQVEVKFDLEHIYKGMFGTCDATVFLPALKKLVVLDYKNGWGEVDAENNPQTMYYALGALTGKHNRAIDKLELVIVQPKSTKKQIKVWECDVVDLMDFRSDLIAAAKKTDLPDCVAIAGPHCQYCPAATVPGRCKALENKVYEIAGAEFDMADNLKLTPPEQLSLDKRKVIWENAYLLEDWLENVKTYNHNQAMKGELLPGTKLVKGRKGAKKWKDEDTAKTMLTTFASRGIIKESVFNTKLKTPTQIETCMSKDDKKLIESLWEQPEGKTVLVHDSDPRPSVTTDINAEFN